MFLKLPIFSNDKAAQVKGVMALFAIADIVRHQRSGVLQLQVDKIIRQILCSHGQFVSVRASLGQESAGSWLVGRGLIKQEVWLALAKQAQANKQQLWTLLAQHLPDNTDVEALKCEHMVAMVRMWASNIQDAILFQPDSSAPSTVQGLSGWQLLLALRSSWSKAWIVQQCPLLEPASFVRLTDFYKASKASLVIDPESQGLLTVIENNHELAEVFRASFLDEDDIYRYLFCYGLMGWLDVVSAEMTARESLLSTMTPEALAIRNHVIRVMQAPEPLGWYEYFGLPSHLSDTELNRQTTAIVERFAAPSVEQLFLPSERVLLAGLLKKMQQARLVLLDPTKRAQYHEQLSPGRQAERVVTEVSKQNILNQIHQALAQDRQAEALALLKQWQRGLTAYELLGLPSNANDLEIRAAYRQRSKQFHPDQYFSHSDDVLKFEMKELFKRVVRAYATLKNPNQRRQYDEKLFATAGSGQVTHQGPQTDHGKKFWKLAQQAIAQQQWLVAQTHLKMAMQCEPQYLGFARLLSETQEKLRLASAS